MSFGAGVMQHREETRERYPTTPEPWPFCLWGDPDGWESPSGAQWLAILDEIGRMELVIGDSACDSFLAEVAYGAVRIADRRWARQGAAWSPPKEERLTRG